MLTDEQLVRYGRQILLHDFDVAGQEKLLASTVMVVGLGGLGSPVAMYLAAAGVGHLVLVDGDQVESSNLQRQIAHGDADLQRNKASSAADTLATLNHQVRVTVFAERLNEDAMSQRLQGVDLVVDATDNYPVRFSLNRACMAAGIPLVSAAAVRTEGQLAVFHPAAGGACYRCLYPEAGDDTALSCSASGVLAPVVGVLGSLQALESIKWLTGYGEATVGRLLVADLRTLEFRTLALTPRADCPDCSKFR